MMTGVVPHQTISGQPVFPGYLWKNIRWHSCNSYPPKKIYNEKADVVRVFYGALYEFVHVICTIRDKFGVYNGNDSTLAKIIYYRIFGCLSDGYCICTCQ